MNYEVTYYIQVKQTVIANTKKEAKEVILNTPFLDLMETITLPAGILVGEPKKINSVLVSNNEDRFSHLTNDIELLSKVIKEINE